ncbi:uncharacterized protein [Physcomitrium patens]|uniref:uncharacterized protein isoform X3 n=1 Tax=Physcomitrium patens TaxID=3218 RepID=UPI003CCE4A95
MARRWRRKKKRENRRNGHRLGNRSLRIARKSNYFALLFVVVVHSGRWRWHGIHDIPMGTTSGRGFSRFMRHLRLRRSKMPAEKEGFEGAAYVPPESPEMRIGEFPEFYLPQVESMSALSSAFQPPWEDWPAWPPPLSWQYPEPIDALHDASCAPHQLPYNVEMCYGPPNPWIWPDPPKLQNPHKDLPVREYLVVSVSHINCYHYLKMIEKVYDLCLEAMKLIVIESFSDQRDQ